MKRNVRWWMRLVALLLTCLIFSGCDAQDRPSDDSESESSDGSQTQPNFNNTLMEGEKTMSVKKNSADAAAFYTNQPNISGADPFILDDTARSGYYYLYSTRDRLAVYRSKDLLSWMNLGDTLSCQNGRRTSKAELTYQICASRIWAPEVIWDAETNLYYMFFSAQPNMQYPDENDAEGQGVQAENLSNSMLNMYLATSASPEGPFELVNFMDADAVRGRYNHSYNTQRGKTTVTAGTHEMRDSKGYVFAYPQYYSSYCYFDPQEMRYAMDKLEGTGVGLKKPSDQIRNAGYAQGIDASPFVPCPI